jgi:hypothetical protein
MTKTRILIGAAGLCAVAGAAHAGGSDYNGGELCPLTTGPDVTLCEVYGIDEYSRNNGAGISGLSVGTTSWNVGTEDLIWQNSPDPDHPFITFNVYRVMNRQVDQIAQGWVKHGFFALSSSQCFDATVGNCQSTDGNWLGVGCTDTYSPGLNASKSGLAPRYEINPWSGEWSYTGSVFQTGGAPTSGVSRHMQIKDSDLNPNLNPGAKYYFEASYIAKDDVCIYNSAAWHQMTPVQSGSGWSFNQPSRFQVPTQNYFIFDALGSAMVTEIAEELPVVEFESPDGRALVLSNVQDRGDGTWQYDYSVQNVDMDRQIDEFRVPLPASADLIDTRFHAVFHHDEPIAYIGGPSISNDPWTMTREGDEIVWSTSDNPIRWGTMYSFGIITDVAPSEGDVTLGMFKDNGPESLSGVANVPGSAPCVGDVTDDGFVDLADLNLVLANFGTASDNGDATGDGNVDLADLNLVLANFGSGC